MSFEVMSAIDHLQLNKATLNNFY